VFPERFDDGAPRQTRLPGVVWVPLVLLVLAIATVVGVLIWSSILGLQPRPGATSPTSAAPPAASGTPFPISTPSTSAAPPSTEAPIATPDATPTATPDSSAAAAAALLDQVPDIAGLSYGTYYREQFGQAWYDEDRNGCDTRNDILGRDLIDVVTKEGTRDCKVLTGTLHDPYTGETISFVSGANTSILVQIDHIIPLSWAWRHGAEAWTFEQRQEFANDPVNLLATSGDVNQSKSDSGPSEWMPPLDAASCDYAKRWVDVLVTWGLRVGSADRAALEDALSTCPV